MIDAAGQSELLAWLTAIGTVAAAIVPLVFFLLERRDRRRAEDLQARAERAREAAEADRYAAEQAHRNDELRLLQQRQTAEREARHRSQAELVHAWVETTDAVSYINYSNSSLAPVHHVKVIVDLLVYDERRDEQMPRKWDLKSLSVLPPTGSTPIRKSVKELRPPEFEDPDPVVIGSTMLGAVTFLDAAGTWWLRDRYGALREEPKRLQPKDPPRD